VCCSELKCVLQCVDVCIAVCVTVCAAVCVVLCVAVSVVLCVAVGVAVNLRSKSDINDFLVVGTVCCSVLQCCVAACRSVCCSELQ